MPSVVNKIQDFSSSVSGNAVSGVNNVLIPLSAEPETNFDVTADWSLASVTDQASFEAFLTSQGATSVAITYFDLTLGRLQAIIDIEGISDLDLNYKGITEIRKLGGFDNSLASIALYDNLLTAFNPIQMIQEGVSVINLSGNQINSFNPSIQLPSSLSVLDLSNNLLVNFNPQNELPISLISLGLSSNQMTTFGYENSESWATAQSSFTSTCIIDFSGNTDSITGSDLETILLTKNVTITA
jgi:Leucine-rich repeat (LRR) protein